MTLSQRLRIGFAVGLAVAVGATGLNALTLVGRQVELLVTEELPLAAHHDRTLRAAGHEVTDATDVATALELARRDPPDLALLDLMMPGRTGLEVVT